MPRRVTPRGDEPERGSARATLPRHLATALLTAALVGLFWRSRMDWVSDMRLWRAVGDASLVLLALALAAGPLAVVAPRTRGLVAWRRAFGIWFALTGLLHAYLVWDGWALWSIKRLLGFQEIPLESGTAVVLVDPGFGLANLIGLVALAWGLVIAAVSSDLAMRALGSRSWKFVQGFAYVVLYLVGLHAAYFLFLHYELTLTSLVFQKAVPNANWFRFWFVGLVLLVLALQTAAFVRTLARDRRGRTPRG